MVHADQGQYWPEAILCGHIGYGTYLRLRGKYLGMSTFQSPCGLEQRSSLCNRCRVELDPTFA